MEIPNRLYGIIAVIVAQGVDRISPQLRKVVVSYALELHKEAQKTENPWDDFLTGMLLTILNVETPSNEE